MHPKYTAACFSLLPLLVPTTSTTTPPILALVFAHVQALNAELEAAVEMQRAKVATVTTELKSVRSHFLQRSQELMSAIK